MALTRSKAVGLTVAAMAVVVVLICSLAVAKHRSRLSSRFHQIHEGMTLTEVTSIVGREGENFALYLRGTVTPADMKDPTIVWFQQHEGLLLVRFQDGVVVLKEFGAYRDEEKAGVVTRILGW